MNFTIGNVRITVSFLLAVGLCAGTLLPGHLLPLLWLAILLHECGHFIYIAAAGKKIGVICISLTGVRIKLAEDRMSRGQELLLNLSGPAVNLLFGGIMLTEKTMQSMRAAAVHWAVAAATLLPLGNSDGTVIVDILLECCCGKLTGRARRWLRRGIGVAAQIEGVYVPSLYDITYHEDGTVAAITPKNGAPATIKKRIMPDFDQADFPENFVVPFIDVVHDRAVTEVLRGCIRGCRFCQAGYIYRPYRERSADVINRQAYDLCHNCGYDEVSLSSLSTSDHSHLAELMEKMLVWAEPEHIDLSLPSLRIDSMTPHLLELVQRVRKSGLTFAPEAGSQRLRDAINKNITEQEVLDTCRMSFENGYTAVKLYFMMGLPTETEEDVKAIIELAQKVVDLFYRLPNKPKGKGVTVNISVACFVPKPFTPFEFEPQDTPEQFVAKQKLLLETVSSRKISISYHDSGTSRIEAILARGDRRLADVVEAVWQEGGRLEGWEDHFSPARWYAAMEQAGLSPDFYATRKREYDELMPWDHLDYFVSKEFLIRENRLTHESKTTPNCRERCSGCGVSKELNEKGVTCSENCPCILR